MKKIEGKHQNSRLPWIRDFGVALIIYIVRVWMAETM